MFTWTHPKKWLILGLIVAVLQPLPAGILVGLGLWSEDVPERKNNGKIITLLAVAVVVIITAVAYFIPLQGVPK